jgi:hypothetical protein
MPIHQKGLSSLDVHCILILVIPQLGDLDLRIAPSKSDTHFKNDSEKVFILSATLISVVLCTSETFFPSNSKCIGNLGIQRPISTSGHIFTISTNGFSFSTIGLSIFCPLYLQAEKLIQELIIILGLAKFICFINK